MARTNYSKIFKRSADCWILKKSASKGKKLIEVLYSDILLLKENSDFKSKTWKQFKTLEAIVNKIEFKYSNTSRKDIDIRLYFEKQYSNKKSSRWIIKSTINPLDLNNQLYFTSSKGNVKELIRHLRNAFSHNLIEKLDDYIVIGDFTDKKHQIDFESPTMLGRIRYKDFVTLITEIKTMEKII